MALKLTVLVDNNTLIDRYLLGEPGISLFLEADGLRVLFDTGYSDAFLRNAAKLGLDLAQLDYLALSHSHEDHTWGLEPLIRLYAEHRLEHLPCRTPTVLAHPKTFTSVLGAVMPDSGPLVAADKLARHFPLRLGREPVWLNPNLVYLGEIPRRNGFEGRLGFGRKDGESGPDTVPEDAALAYRSPRGLVVMVGCSHAGVCNTIEHAREVCGESRVADVVGGFHLQRAAPEHLQGTLAYFERLAPAALHACHCTDLAAKIALARVANLQEVGAGLVLDYP